MWIPKQLKLRRFNAHRETVFDFIQGETLLVQGKNYDDDEQESNGSGKSGIVEAAHTCLTGEQIRGKELSVSDLIMNGENDCELEIEFNNTKTEKKLKIHRTLFRTKSSKLEIWVDDEEEKFSSIVEGNKRVFELLGIDKEDLTNYFIINKEKYVSFFYSPDSKKKEVIARFSGADLMNGIEDEIQIDIDSKENDIDKLKNRILSIDAKVLVYNEQIKEEEQKDFEKEKEKKVDECNKRIDIYKGHKKLINESKQEIESKIKNEDKINKEKEKLKKEYEDKLKEFKEWDLKIKTKDIIEKQELIDVEEIDGEKKKGEIKEEIKELNKEIEEFESLLSELRISISGVIECPKCLNKFIVGKKIDIKLVEKEIPKIEEEIKNIKKDIEKKNLLIESFIPKEKNREERRLKLKEEYKKIEQDVDRHNKIKSDLELSIKDCGEEISRIIRRIQQFKKDIDECNERYDSHTQNIINIEEEIEEIKKEKGDEKIKEYEEKIGVLNEERNVLGEEELKIVGEKENIIVWIHNFKRFNTYLANKAISGIENFTNYYLSKIKTNLGIKIEGYKVLQSGEVREKITSQILRNGIEEGVFGKFSKGEKGKIELCNIITMQQLINLNSKTGGVDLLMIDEVLDSIDSVGIESIVSSMKNLKRTLVLITHSQHEKNENIRTVIKKNGISKLEL